MPSPPLNPSKIAVLTGAGVSAIGRPRSAGWFSQGDAEETEGRPVGSPDFST